MCGTPWARAPEDGTGPRERGPGPQRNGSSGPGPRVFDIEQFLGRGGHTMVILCNVSHYWTLVGKYLNVDDSETIFSGLPVNSSFIWDCSPSRPSGMIKNCEKKNFFAFLDVSDQKENISFFPKKIIFYYQPGPGVFLWGPGPGSTAHM
jgi:hypothetical protein